MSTIRVLLIDERDESAGRVAGWLAGAQHPRIALDRVRTLDEAGETLHERRHDALLVDERIGPDRLRELLDHARAVGLSAPIILLVEAPADDEIPVAPGVADAIGTQGLTAGLLRRAIRYAVDRARGAGALKESEERLILAQRMESLGRLAGGVAHDFNNLLTGILGYASILERETPRDQPSRRPIEEIRKASEQASILTRQLLAYGRKQATRKAPLDLNSVLDGLGDMLKRIAGDHVSLDFQRAPDLAPVVADAGQIEQIILNLALNARDATKPGGRITISTSTIIVADADARREGLPQGGQFVRVTVQDTGEGIDAELLPRVFEPFFTTKPVGKGTGLGLSSVQAIARQSGGFVTVDSARGVGTTVSVHLPVDRPQGASRAAFRALPDYRGTETVLVIEDDETVRTFVKEALGFYGYRPLLAADPAVALKLAQESPEPIAAAVTDIVLPDMSGMHLAQQLTAIRPGLEVIFMSGYIDAKSGHVALPPDAHFLRKPFAPEELARLLRGVLDAAAIRSLRNGF